MLLKWVMLLILIIGIALMIIGHKKAKNQQPKTKGKNKQQTVGYCMMAAGCVYLIISFVFHV
jgi:hypothetical protein